MATLTELEKRLAKVVRRLDLGLTAVMTTVITSIGAELVPTTPVKTGFARGNWRPSLNAPAIVPITFLDLTGAATVAKIGVVASRFKLGDIFFLVSNIDYIASLNRGSSPQAPPGFVQNAVRDGTARALASFERGIIKGSA